MKIIIVIVIISFVAASVILSNRKKESYIDTKVSEETDSSLIEEDYFPEEENTAENKNFGSCVAVGVTGAPPNAKLVEPDLFGEEKRPGFEVTGIPNIPPILFVNEFNPPHFDIWELSENLPTQFIKKRNFQLNTEQGQWYRYSIMEVTCLPLGKQLVVIDYAKNGQAVHKSLYLYEAQKNEFQFIADKIERDWWKGSFISYVSGIPAGDQAALVVYRSNLLRLASETYVNQNDHILLFSPKYSKGLQLLDLSIDKGSITEMKIINKKLWIKAIDPRIKGEPRTYLWSLDLSKVL